MGMLATLIIGGIIVQEAAAETEAAPEIRTIGHLVPETGGAAAANQIDAIMFALNEFNQYLQNNGADWRLDIATRDTKSDPAEALRLMQELNGTGIEAVIGPATSASVREIKDYADANDIAVISYSSGAADLAIPDDMIFRTISDTSSMSAAIYRQMHDDGIMEVISIFVDDAIGRSVNQTTYEAVSSGDRIVMRGSIKFSPDIADVSAVTSNLRDLLAAEPPITDYGSIGIIIFDYRQNLVDMVQDAASTPIPHINKTRWYGPDHKMSELAANPLTKAFLLETGYKSFVAAYGENEINIRIDSQINGANTYSYAAYDALFIMGRAVEIAGGIDGDAIAAAIPVAARAGHGPELHAHVEDAIVCGAGGVHQYSGALGSSIELNEAGDLAASDFHIYSIVGDGFEATHRYDPATDSILEFTLPDKRAVGVLVSETGALAQEIGIAASEAVSLAAYNYNLELANKGADWRLEIVKRDDKTHPPITLENTRAFHSEGIRALVGPMTSGSLSSILDYVNGNGMVAVSYGSSSPTLAMPDNVFRMRSNDEYSTKVYAKLLEHDRIKNLVIIHRDDPWGTSLNDYITERAEMLNGTTVLPSIVYAAAAPADSDTDYQSVIETLKFRLDGIDTDGAAVMLFGFEEIWDIIDIAKDDPDLQEGKWYAYLSSTEKPSAERAAWMEGVAYTGVITQPVENDLNRHIDANVPGSNVYSYHAYDALYTVAEAVRDSGTGQDAEMLRKAIPGAAAGLWPTAVGFPTMFDEAGDLANAGYDVYQVKDGALVPIASYNQVTDALDFVESARYCSLDG